MNEKHMPCAYWREGEICAKGTEPGYTDFCVLGPCSQMKPSNADKIRQMSDEELAEYLAERSAAPSCTGRCHKDYTVYGERRTFCQDCWLEWLKQEAMDE